MDMHSMTDMIDILSWIMACMMVKIDYTYWFVFLSCFNTHMHVWHAYWFYHYMLIKVSLQRLLFLKQHLLLCEATPQGTYLGASIVFENLLANTSHLVHVMDKSLLIVNFKYVVSAVPDTSCELLPSCNTRTYTLKTTFECSIIYYICNDCVILHILCQ